jgi:immune inhibitor A
MPKRNVLLARAAGVVSLIGILAAAPTLATVPAPDGTLPPAVRAAFASGVLGVPARPALGTSSTQTDWLVPVVMVSFTDSTLVHGPTELAAAMFDTTHATPTGSVVDYYDWVSRGRLRIRGEVVAAVTLPHDANYYAYDANGLNSLGTPNNDWGLVRDAVGSSDAQVDWNRYDRNGDGFVDMLWVVHAGLGGEGTQSRRSLWSITGSLSSGWSRGSAIETSDFIPGSTIRHVRVDRFSILPEMSLFRPGQLSEIGVYCHEFGHALGLPDLYDTSSLGGTANVGPGNWSLMSTGAYGGTGRNPESPSAPGAWCMLYLGLANRLQPTADTLVTLQPITRGGDACVVWFQGEEHAEHFLIEARAREGFDQGLPGEGLLVYQVDDALMGVRLPGNAVNVGPDPALRMFEANDRHDLTTGANHGDAGDPMPGTGGIVRLDDDSSPSLRTVSGQPTNLAIDDVARDGLGVRVFVRVRAPDWRPVQDLTTPEFGAAPPSGRGRYVTLTPQGIEYAVYSDAGRLGHSQVMLRKRAYDGTWAAPVTVSASPRNTHDPSLAQLPGGDLAVTWVDDRASIPQIWYRARVLGVWTAERALTSGGAYCGSPAIATDARGRVYVTWIETAGATTRVRLLVFTWSNPFGTPVTVSKDLDQPSAPSIATAPNGKAMVLWPDRRTGNYLLQFARYDPDSGVQARIPLTGSSLYPQPSGDVTADSLGTFYLAWQQLSGGNTEIHAQRRPAFSVASHDTIVENSTDGLQNPSIAVDRDGALHLAFERTTPYGQQVRYMRWWSAHGWDAVPTDISDPLQGSAERVGLVALAKGGVDVLWSDFDGITQRLRARDRRAIDATPLDVPRVSARPLPLRIGPNPLPAGAELRLAGPALAEQEQVQLYDMAGRRVATAAVSAGGARFAPQVTRALVPGLYFASVRGREAARVVVIR